MEKYEILEILNELKLSVKFEFVPFSKSRNAVKNPKVIDLSLNYKGHIFHNEKEILVLDYQMGIGHSPAYKKCKNDWCGRYAVDEVNEITREAESGKTRMLKEILPEAVDFFYCIVSDCDVVNYSSFEDWASNFGYEEDSRKAEKIYNECLKTSLKFKSAIGFEGLEKLQEAFQDY